MTDTRLRDLERASRTGDPAARAELLTARLRAGTLSQERLELAAYCGDSAARALVPDEPRSFGSPTPDHEEDCPGCGWYLIHRYDCPAETFSQWLCGLSASWADAGPVPGWALVRASVAAARLALHWCAESLGVDFEVTPYGFRADATRRRREGLPTSGSVEPVTLSHEAIESVDAWLACPCTGHWERRHVAYVEAGHRAWITPPGNDRALESVPHAARLAGESSVRSAIQSSLVTWALGETS